MGYTSVVVSFDSKCHLIVKRMVQENRVSPTILKVKKTEVGSSFEITRGRYTIRCMVLDLYGLFLTFLGRRGSIYD